VLGGTNSRLNQNKLCAVESINLAARSKEDLEGIEYRALRVLLKVTTGESITPEITNTHRLLPWSSSLWNHLFSALDSLDVSDVQTLPLFVRLRQIVVVCACAQIRE
jgi:hypothetical protein